MGKLVAAGRIGVAAFCLLRSLALQAGDTLILKFVLNIERKN